MGEEREVLGWIEAVLEEPLPKGDLAKVDLSNLFLATIFLVLEVFQALYFKTCRSIYLKTRVENITLQTSVTSVDYDIRIALK